MNCVPTLFLIGLFLLSPFFTPAAMSAQAQPLQIKKQPEIRQVKTKKPVKIKLKRLSEGKYTWDLSGDDVDEIIKADRRLRKLLHLE
jgi:hypothetical protein